MGGIEMQFRCYMCGLVMHDGIPPLEALSAQQAAEVGAPVPEGERRFHTLEGTPYEGMSVYSFCSFCLTYITEYPSAERCPCDVEWTQNRDWTNPISTQAVVCSTHGDLVRITINTEDGGRRHKHQSFTRDHNAIFNRAIRMHQAEQAYPNADLSFLKELQSMDVDEGWKWVLPRSGTRVRYSRKVRREMNRIHAKNVARYGEEY